ncbi:MAG: peptidoglycan editing factor PgeF [Methanobacteriota archaeon]|nr:MAG: peptidoglycan editing factor PgeF [Euryarchaeota archaeon]
MTSTNKITNSAILYDDCFPKGIHGYTSLAYHRKEEVNAGTSSTPEEETHKWLSEHGIPFSRVVTAGQVHSNTVSYVDKPGHVPATDGLYTDHSNLYLTIRTADCAAVMISTSTGSVIGIAHSGWRGTHRKIVQKLVEEIYNYSHEPPESYHVVISPHIKSCCYQVGQEFLDMFPSEVLLQRGKELFLNLEKAIQHQLISSGITESHIDSSPHCTACSSLPLYSYRRQRTSHRLLNIIVKKGETTC